MNTLEDLSIENIVNEIFTNYSIKKKKKDIVAFYCQKFQMDLFGEQESGNITEEQIYNKVETVLKEDRKSQFPFLTFSNSFYRRAKRKAAPINPTTLPDSNYLGKGGECLVMGELLFRGFNVNSMMVDEGIDLVACKDNVFFLHSS